MKFITVTDRDNVFDQSYSVRVPLQAISGVWCTEFGTFLDLNSGKTLKTVESVVDILRLIEREEASK